jgi:hypothetical protein
MIEISCNNDRWPPLATIIDNSGWRSPFLPLPAMPYVAVTQTHVCHFWSPSCGIASAPHSPPCGPVLWALLCHALWWQLSPSCLWAQHTVPLARMGGCSGHRAGRALVHMHRPPCGSTSAFSTTPAQEGHDPWVAQVYTLVLTTLTLPLGLLGWHWECGWSSWWWLTKADNNRWPTTDQQWGNEDQ